MAVLWLDIAGELLADIAGPAFAEECIFKLATAYD